MTITHHFDAKSFVVEPGSELSLSKWSTTAGDELKDKDHGGEALAADVSALQEAQQVLYASGSRAVLIILQGMDAAGKDSTIRHVIGAINPQGCRVYSFRQPNETELQHHFLWRPAPYLPERGMISIFNRSYYEEVLAVRVHPEFLIPQKIPGLEIDNAKHLRKLWKLRYKQIKAFEQALTLHGTVILKFFLHVSRQEQKERFLERLTKPDKYWKFKSRDLLERSLWSNHQRAFEEALSATSTEHAPWYVIPADNKWYLRAAVADIVAAKLESLDMKYPKVEEDELVEFRKLAEKLRSESDTDNSPLKNSR